MSVLIIDYGLGNLSSVARSVEKCGAEVIISDDPRALRQADRAILPGVGAFADGMANLRARGWDIALNHWVAEKMPLLGICLGMQLLAEQGYEVKKTAGLGLIPGEVTLLDVPSEYRLPHVGWNEVMFSRADPLFANIFAGNDFYFVHSFHFQVTHSEHILGTTDYGKPFVSAVRRDSVFGVQFHPEKSSRPGFQLLKNFLQFSIS